jgi:TonB family protein
MVFTSPVIAQTLQGRIKSIRVVGLPESAGAELLATLPVHEGDELNAETIQRVSQAAKAYDEHLTVQYSAMERTPSGGTDVSLAISAPGIRPAVQTVASTAGAMQVDSDVESALIVRKVAPVYPPLAKSARVAGAVRLSAVIGRDGTVQELHSLDGPALLIQAAMDAVKQWIYKPTLLNGNPVPVQTTIIINFTLAE